MLTCIKIRAMILMKDAIFLLKDAGRIGKCKNLRTLLSGSIAG